MSVLDITPLIKAKAQSKCQHPQVEVSMDSAELTCAVCGAELDPWWYIRREATEDGARIEAYNKRFTDLDAQYAEKVNWCNAQLQRLNAEIQQLADTKNRLWNEKVDGKPLGTYRKARARKS